MDIYYERQSGSPGDGEVWLQEVICQCMPAVKGIVNMHSSLQVQIEYLSEHINML